MYYVYILSNHSRTVFYTGMTDNLGRRMHEHKNKLLGGFTSKYDCNVLLYFEEFDHSDGIASRERQIKRYKREWKRNLINSINPDWIDLSIRFPFDI